MDAEINNHVLRLARERINLDLVSASKKIGISNPEILELAEKGERKITFKQAERAAHVYDIPLAYFYFEDIPEDDFPLLDYRLHPDAVGKNLKPSLMKDIFKAIRRRDTILELSRELGSEQKKFSLSCDLENNPEEVGISVRSLLPINLFTPKSKRVSNVIDFFENEFGIYVVQVGGARHTKVDYEDFDGAAIYFDNLPIIIINTHERGHNRQIFTLFHELSHLMLKNRVITDFYSGAETGASQSIQSIETFCNKVSASVLVPQEQLLGTFDGENYSNLSNMFKVSREVVVIRLRNLGAISQEKCDLLLKQFQDEFLKSYREKNSSSSSGPNPNTITLRNMGNLFTNIIRESFSDGKISYYDAITELKLKDKPARAVLYGS